MVAFMAGTATHTTTLQLEDAVEGFLAAARLPSPNNCANGPVPRGTSYGTRGP